VFARPLAELVTFEKFDAKYLTHFSPFGGCPFIIRLSWQGCNHDRGTSNACTNTNYNYGFRDPAGQFRSILAYSCSTGQCDGNPYGGSCTRVQRFSNNYPNYNLYNSKPIGNASNDNARRINDVALGVSNYYATVPTGTNAPTTSAPTAPTNAPTPAPSMNPTTTPSHSPTTKTPSRSPITRSPTCIASNQACSSGSNSCCSGLSCKLVRQGSYKCRT
jgi:hypothetical protein